MLKPTQAQVVSTLRAQGYHFRGFQFSVEDPCSAEDVDWNYKDIAHPHFLHRHVRRCYAFADADGYSCIDLHRVLGFQLAQSVSTWVSGPNRLTTQTVSFFLIFLIEVSIEDVDENRARTTTRYEIGATSRPLLALAFPAPKWLLQRNCNEFLREDQGMRVRRGELRRQGFRFAKHGIASTLQISANNVVPPAVPCTHGVTCIDLTQRDGRMIQIGRSDHFGLQVALQPDRVEIYPRLCPHEGACLDALHAPGQPAIQCPWHGRSFQPIVTLAYTQTPTTVLGVPAGGTR